MKVIHSVLTCVLALFLPACATNPAKKIHVSLGERTDLYFTGRGSAAGIMMDTYMGGAGVAIGIAIDEGIAKDISSAILANNPKFSIVGLIKDALYKQMKADKSIGSLHAVVIEKYGFRSAADDKVSPILELKLLCASGTVRGITFSDEENKHAIPFDKVKVEGVLAEKKLREASEYLLNTNASVCN